MSNTDFLGRAIDTVKNAIEHDNAGEYEKAYQTYYSALELFMLALKWEKNPKSKEMIRSKAGEYMDRAEKLKNHLANSDNSKKPSAVGANGKVANGGGKACVLTLHFTYIFISILFIFAHTNLFSNMTVARKTTKAKMQKQRSCEVPCKAPFYRRSLIFDGRTSRAWKTQRTLSKRP